MTRIGVPTGWLPVVAALAVAARTAGAASLVDCRVAGSACTLAQAARQSGIHLGAAVASGLPAVQRADAETHCSAVTTENAFKWGEMAPAPGVIDFTVTDTLVEWAAAHGLRLRAHNLFWHRYQMPAWVRPMVESAADPAATLRALMREQVDAVVGRYAGRVALWDVVNEPFASFGDGFDTTDSATSPKNIFYTTLGITYVADAFRWAHRADPRARLFLNEFVWDPRRGDARAEALLALVADLRAQHVPIHGVGLQMHGMLGVHPPFFPDDTAAFAAYLEAFRRLHVKVELTELDVRLPLLADQPDPLAAQADVYRRVVTACTAVRHCTGVTVWGLRDPDTWLDTFPLTSATAPNRPLLLDGDGATKPAYAATREALLRRCAPRASAARPCGRLWPRR